MALIALVPAHNEEKRLGVCLSSLLSQTCVPDRIIVVSDNSTDHTSDIALGYGAPVELLETQENNHKKAGALNQVLNILFCELEAEDHIFIMDADSQIVPTFLASASEHFDSDENIGAIGGVFLTDETQTWLGQLQASEYWRYEREIARDNARARVLTGTATFTTVGMLRSIQQSRTVGTLPGCGVYNQDALCEDFELTLSIKTLGFQTISPQGCQVYTEAMLTTGDLWRQRVRWQRGAIQALSSFGLTRVTFPYIAKQVQTTLGIVFFFLLTFITAWSLSHGLLAFQAPWFCIGMLFLIERVVSVWRGGPWAIRIAAMFLPELCYDLFLSAVYIWVFWLTMTNQQLQWGIKTIDTQDKE